MTRAAVFCVFFAGVAAVITSCPSWRSSSHVVETLQAATPPSSQPVALTPRDEAYGYFGAACLEMIGATDLDDEGKASDAEKQWRRAADDLEKAAHKDPGSVEIRRSLAGCCFRLGDAQKAAATIQQLAAIMPNDARAHIEIAQSWKALNKNQEAAAEYEAAIKLTKPGAGLWRAAAGELADLYRAMSQPAKAVPLYRQLLEQKPQHAPTQLDLGFALGDAARHNDAIQTVLPLLEGNANLDPASLVRACFFLAGEYAKAARVEEGIKVFADLARAHPESAEICQSRMQLLEAAGQLNGAVALGVDFLAVQKDADAVRLITAGLQEKAGQPQRAIDLYREGISEDEPFRTIAARQMILMGLRLIDQKKPDLALQDFEIIYSSNNLDDSLRAEARLQASVVLRQKGEPQKAIEVLKPLISTEERRNWRVGLLYADFLRTTGETAQALKYLEGMLEHHAKDTEALEAIHVQMAVVCQMPDINDPQNAEEHLKAALTLNPDSAAAQNGLGYLYAQEGKNLEEAERLLTAALKKMPGEPAFLDSMGWVQYKLALRDNDLARLHKAFNNLQAAAAGEPDSIVYDHLADVSFVSGDWETAKQYWEKSLAAKEEPGGEQIGRALVQRKLAKVTALLTEELRQSGKPRKPADRIVRPLAPPPAPEPKTI